MMILSNDYSFKKLFNLNSDTLQRKNSIFDFNFLFQDIEYINKSMDRLFSEFNDIPVKALKYLIKKSENQYSGTIKKVKSFVYGYSVTIGQDVKCKLKNLVILKQKLLQKMG